MQMNWDERSKTYPRYGEKYIMQDKQKIISWCEEKGVKFSGEILSIGAGSGVLEILIAKKFPVKITAIDSSQKMLENFALDAKTQGVSNKINIIKSDFDDFKSDKKFDLAIACMTPAINDPKAAKKLMSFSKNLGLHVSWATQKKCDFIDEIVSTRQKCLSSSCLRTQQMCEFLEQNGIKFEMEIFDGGWVDIMSQEAAFEYAKSALLRENLEINEEKIKSVIAKFTQNDGVHIEVKAKKGMILFLV